MGIKIKASLVPSIALLKYRIKCNWTGPLTEIKGHVLHKGKDLLRRPYLRTSGLTKPSVGKYIKNKIYIDIFFQMIMLPVATAWM